MKMKFLYQFSVLCVLLVDYFAICQYQWACTAPDGRGYQYLPSERDHGALSATGGEFPSSGDLNGLIYVYRVPILDASCYDQVIARIEYCYRYNRNAVSGQPNFSRKVLILEDTGSNYFVVSSTYAIQTRSSMDNANCTSSGSQTTCCDRTIINDKFNLPMNFIFGVTESSQENTHNAGLLRFPDIGDNLVDTHLVNKATDQALSMGSRIMYTNQPPPQRGLLLLWFVIGNESSITVTTIPPTTSSSTTIEPPMLHVTDLPTLITDMNTDPDAGVSTQSTISTSTSPVAGQSLVSNSLGPAVGGAVGGLTVVIIIIVVVVIALLFIKRGQKGSLKVNNRKESVQGFNNAVYDANTSNTKIHLDIPNKSASFSKASYEYITEQTQREELGHDYSLPSEIHNGKLRPKHPTQENAPVVPEYATAAYEIPASTSPYEAALSQTKTSADYNEDIYMVPASNEDALYSQLSQIRIHNFTRDSIRLIELLGAGQFGKVHQGEWTAPGSKDTIDVAVKTLQEGASEEDKVKFLQEAAIMGQFSHPNVVKLYGVVTEGEPVLLVIELLPKGDLREVLCSIRSEPSSEVKIDADLPHTLLSYCRQVASGMCYLAGKLFVHRDLAARNILVSEDGACKIADFGMSRDLADTNYYVSHGGKIPVKWTAPEALHYKKYSTASDVWSFGCVIYEIWSLGHKPFEQYSNQDSIKLIDNGIRLLPPSGCPRAIYKLMIDCWHPESSSRPDFVSVVQQLSLPDTKLLKWSEEDKATDPEAATLGAELDKAVDLYKDLQKTYVTN